MEDRRATVFPITEENMRDMVQQMDARAELGVPNIYELKVIREIIKRGQVTKEIAKIIPSYHLDEEIVKRLVNGEKVKPYVRKLMDKTVKIDKKKRFRIADLIITGECRSELSIKPSRTVVSLGPAAWVNNMLRADIEGQYSKDTMIAPTIDEAIDIDGLEEYLITIKSILNEMGNKLALQKILVNVFNGAIVQLELGKANEYNLIIAKSLDVVLYKSKDNITEDRLRFLNLCMADIAFNRRKDYEVVLGETYVSEINKKNKSLNEFNKLKFVVINDISKEERVAMKKKISELKDKIKMNENIIIENYSEKNITEEYLKYNSTGETRRFHKTEPDIWKERVKRLINYLDRDNRVKGSYRNDECDEEYLRKFVKEMIRHKLTGMVRGKEVKKMRRIINELILSSNKMGILDYSSEKNKIQLKILKLVILSFRKKSFELDKYRIVTQEVEEKLDEEIELVIDKLREEIYNDSNNNLSQEFHGTISYHNDSIAHRQMVNWVGKMVPELKAEKYMRDIMTLYSEYKNIKNMLVRGLDNNEKMRQRFKILGKIKGDGLIITILSLNDDLERNIKNGKIRVIRIGARDKSKNVKWIVEAESVLNEKIDNMVKKMKDKDYKLEMCNRVIISSEIIVNRTTGTEWIDVITEKDDEISIAINKVLEAKTQVDEIVKKTEILYDLGKERNYREEVKEKYNRVADDMEIKIGGIEATKNDIIMSISTLHELKENENALMLDAVIESCSSDVKNNNKGSIAHRLKNEFLICNKRLKADYKEKETNVEKINKYLGTLTPSELIKRQVNEMNFHRRKDYYKLKLRKMIEKLVEQLKKYRVINAFELETYVGALIERASMIKIKGYYKKKLEGNLYDNKKEINRDEIIEIAEDLFRLDYGIVQPLKKYVIKMQEIFNDPPGFILPLKIMDKGGELSLLVEILEGKYYGAGRNGIDEKKEELTDMIEKNKNDPVILDSLEEFVTRNIINAIIEEEIIKYYGSTYRRLDHLYYLNETKLNLIYYDQRQGRDYCFEIFNKGSVIHNETREMIQRELLDSRSEIEWYQLWELNDLEDEIKDQRLGKAINNLNRIKNLELRNVILEAVQDWEGLNGAEKDFLRDILILLKVNPETIKEVTMKEGAVKLNFSGINRGKTKLRELILRILSYSYYQLEKDHKRDILTKEYYSEVGDYVGKNIKWVTTNAATEFERKFVEFWYENKFTNMTIMRIAKGEKMSKEQLNQLRKEDKESYRSEEMGGLNHINLRIENKWTTNREMVQIRKEEDGNEPIDIEMKDNNKYPRERDFIIKVEKEEELKDEQMSERVTETLAEILNKLNNPLEVIILPVKRMVMRLMNGEEEDEIIAKYRREVRNDLIEELKNLAEGLIKIESKASNIRTINKSYELEAVQEVRREVQIYKTANSIKEILLRGNWNENMESMKKIMKSIIEVTKLSLPSEDKNKENERKRDMERYLCIKKNKREIEELQVYLMKKIYNNQVVNESGRLEEIYKRIIEARSNMNELAHRMMNAKYDKVIMKYENKHKGRQLAASEGNIKRALIKLGTSVGTLEKLNDIVNYYRMIERISKVEKLDPWGIIEKHKVLDPLVIKYFRYYGEKAWLRLQAFISACKENSGEVKRSVINTENYKEYLLKRDKNFREEEIQNLKEGINEYYTIKPTDRTSENGYKEMELKELLQE